MSALFHIFTFCLSFIVLPKLPSSSSGVLLKLPNHDYWASEETDVEYLIEYTFMAAIMTCY